MITLSESAERCLHDYLRQARAYLRGSKSVDAEEVEQNITEHIENELAGAAEPGGGRAGASCCSATTHSTQSTAPGSSSG